MKLAKITREVLFFPSLGSAAESDAEDMESPFSWCWMFVAAWRLGAFFLLRAAGFPRGAEDEARVRLRFGRRA